MARTILVGIFLTLYLIFVAPIFLLHCVVTRRVELLYRVGVGGAKLAMRLAGVRVRVEGLERVPAGPCVFVANHVSNVDPPAVVAAIPQRVALMAKKEVYRVPILAQALRLGDFVSIDRANPEAARQSVEEALGKLQRGISFLIFAEGTRSPDARLRPFKRGAFLLAVRAGVPVVPVSVINSHRIMPKGESAIRPGEVVVRFHPALDARAYTQETVQGLVERAQAAVASGLPDEQKMAM